jgi:NodT family efflux transporter outer membrane factor (OMF) lipoprotein
MSSSAPTRLALLATLATLAACRTVGPDYVLPQDSLYQQPAANAAFADTGNAALAPGAELPAHWWRLYQDPTLDGLVEQALRNNADLKVAAANLRRSAAVYEQALAAGGFDYSVEAEAVREQVSAESHLLSDKLPVSNLADGKFSISYQFDLFGKLKRGTEAAHADTQATQAAMDLARVSVVAQVTSSYMEICHAGHELQVAEHSLALQRRSHEVARRLNEAGRGTPPDLARAIAQVAMLQAALPPLQARRQSAGYSLAALLGLLPGQLPEQVTGCVHAPELQQPLPLGDGRALLARRPDVRQAERRLAAASARIGVATAELYPDISLGASAGATGLLKHIGDPATQTWAIGPLISWTLPSTGAHAQVRAAEAGADAALADFDRVVLNALREVQTALSRYAQDLRRVQMLQEAQRQSELAAEQNRRLYQGGRTPYLSSLDAERSLASADTTLAASEAQLAQDQVQLFLALGGGWEQGASASAN